jgi:anthranilate/para-aminobenzoate synthase component I
MEELFASTFPGGSVTGAPKIRAMEILRDLEVAPRWVYTGALGTIDDRGQLDLALPIRTLWIERDQITFPVGGGIVADSTPQSEWEESQHKAAAIIAALRGE